MPTITNITSHILNIKKIWTSEHNISSYVLNTFSILTTISTQVLLIRLAMRTSRDLNKQQKMYDWGSEFNHAGNTFFVRNHLDWLKLNLCRHSPHGVTIDSLSQSVVTCLLAERPICDPSTGDVNCQREKDVPLSSFFFFFYCFWSFVCFCIRSGLDPSKQFILQNLKKSGKGW